MIIYIARHGQTTGDIEQRYGGDYDDHLTKQGEEQAMTLAENFSNKDIEQLFSSPLIRAQETASFIAQQLDLKVETINNFREQNRYGILTGITKSEAKEKYSNEVEKLKVLDSHVECAEDYNIFCHRIKSALDYVSSTSFNKVAIVTHGGPIRYIFRDILDAGEVDVEDCAYFKLDFSEGTYNLINSKGINIK